MSLRRERRVVVTGAAGFIGSHLVRRLRADGYVVVGIDAFHGTTTAAVAADRLAELSHDPGFDLLDCDPLRAGIASCLRNAEAVFHLAARPGARDPDHTSLTEGNVELTKAVLTQAESAGVPDFVFASSSAIYGAAGRWHPSRESDTPAPMSIYGETKLAGERLCLGRSGRTTIVRLFTVYGPGQRADMAFSRFIAAARSGRAAPLYQDPGAGRDFTYVEDAVDGLMRAWQHGKASVYNISGGGLITLGAGLQLITELMGAPVPLQVTHASPQPSKTVADLSLARGDLRYEPRVGLREGLQRQIRYPAACAGTRRY